MNQSNKWDDIVGIDISKCKLDCYLVGQKTNQKHELQVDNSNDGFDNLGQWLAKHNADSARAVLVSEHTGRYDARLLADYGIRFSDRLRLAKAPQPAVGQIKRLQAERRKMVDQRAAVKSKLTEADTHDADMSQLTTMWVQQIELLGDHIDQLEKTMNQLIRQDELLKDRHQTMRTAPGIGPILGRFWMSAFAGQQKLDARKISSRFGFAPHGSSSGSSVKSPDRSTGYGNSEMRKLMHQAARSVAHHKPHYRNYYKGKIAEGKHELVAINNIINKLIRLYCAMWNNRAEYDPDYIQKNKQMWKKSAYST